ncbi:Putative glucose-methanol-choline oxidoreductase, FAD/NAD(P)-binding domain superfamily [Septoria linicola]|uniref:Glucose-methanol-choline oxidoreductase, FAD/NAD(P)-binding domain superfamily n=1 Tax=Septoria linicola TaxID=215465 RepID=A0A9Q9ALK0_9PEZI|nr:Putative glucose-methanol-choline oxidoreductase, FAD/NAD(P)-binding domain superfamily [Septoria linicola]
MLPVLLVLLTSARCILGSPVETDPQKRQIIGDVFDYVIVGGGTAGLTLANRLSANGDNQVAVVEAGDQYQINNPLLSSTPAGDVYWVGSDPSDTNPLVDWNFVQTFIRLANDLLYVTAQFATDYLLGKRGPLTNPVCEFLGWEKVPAILKNLFSSGAKSQLDQFPSDWPEIEYLSAPGYVGDFSSLPTTQPKVIAVTTFDGSKVMCEQNGFRYATILAALVAPTSRGNVSIVSADSDDLPSINPAWLTTIADQEVAIAAYKRARAAFASRAMRPVLADSREYFPGEEVSTDAQILDTIRNTHNRVACCRNLVYGVGGLRVVDASAFPILPPGHPQSTIYALAEKIADHILNGD